ncbi:MAG: FAD-dependent monooxygenase [Gammaproteobacteria bacterium]|nr:FAD-dependent monooxygenase [Gammaproteobacteria bacterium]
MIAELINAEGVISKNRFTYVVGCDGGHSSVRALLNIAYQQQTYFSHFILMDAILEESYSDKNLHYFLTDKGYLILVPLPEKKYRLIASLKGNHPGKDQVDLSIENFQKILNERGAGNIWIKKSIWSTSANFYHKLADCAMQGNTFLVGDALHQFSPVGGTNMNTGIQDAFHLAEKITLVKKKKQAVSYLESYASERMQAAKKIMAVTENATNLLTRNSSSIEEEQKYLPLMRNRSFIKSALPRLFSGLDFMG